MKGPTLTFMVTLAVDEVDLISDLEERYGDPPALPGRSEPSAMIANLIRIMALHLLAKGPEQK